MSKYYRLREFLAQADHERIPMTFADIEKILEFSLPASKQYPAWWSNNPSNNPMTREWLDAGFETESVNISGEKLVFRKVRKPQGVASAGESATALNPRRAGFGFMKGLLTIEPGYDLTTPSGELWFEGIVTRATKHD